MAGKPCSMSGRSAPALGAGCPEDCALPGIGAPCANGSSRSRKVGDEGHGGALHRRSEPLPREWLPIPPAHSSTAAPLRHAGHGPTIAGTPIATNAGTKFRLFASRGGYREVSGASGGFRGAAAGGAASRPRGSSHSGTSAGACFLRRRGIPAGGRSLWQAVSGRGFAADAARSAHRLPDQSARSPRMRTAPLSAEEAKAA